MIGPKKLIINKFEYQLRAVTCIDDVMNLSEVIPTDNAKSRKLVEVFEDGWLNRYPIPCRCAHDIDNEFLGPAFYQMPIKNNIYPMSTTIKKSQANTIVERFHQTLDTIIFISLHQKPPTTFVEVSSLQHRKYCAAQMLLELPVIANAKFLIKNWPLEEIRVIHPPRKLIGMKF